MRYLVYIVLFTVCVTKLMAKDIGASCHLNRTGEAGICKFLSDCEIASQMFTENGVYPDLCTFIGNNPVPVVCCMTTIESMLLEKSSNRTSVKKCKQYKDSVYKTVLKANILNGPPIIQKVLQCSYINAPLTLGGIFALPREFPHIALIGYQTNMTNEILWGCSGSLISEKFILTAAHCILTPRITGPPKFILLGEYDLGSTNDDAQPLQINVAECIPHPQFKRTSKYFDIGLIRLEQSITFNQYIRPACLPETYEIPSPRVFSTGWSRMDYENDKSSGILKKKVLDIFTFNECNATYENEASSSQLSHGIIEDMQFCAGLRSNNGNTENCKRDIVGDILQTYHPYNTCMYTVNGIVSFGKCQSLDVYTRVFTYLDWIEENVWPNQH